MKIQQAVVTRQHHIELQSAELSEELGASDILIETESTFISAGTELSIYTGTEERALVPGNWCSYPYVPGYANVGVVKAVGSGVDRAKPGDRVFTFGAHASAIRVKNNHFLIQVPENMNSSAAAASRMAAVAATASIVSEWTSSPWVAVFGLGMVGNLAAQIFQLLGCRVIGIDPNRFRCGLAEKCGITHTVSGNADEVKTYIQVLTGGKMAHISVDAVGHSRVVMQALDVTAKFGQLVLLGSPRAPVEGNVTQLLSDIHLRMITVRGALEWCLPPYSDFPTVRSLHSKQEDIFQWMQEGKLAINPLISHHVRPEQIKHAYDGLLNHPNEFSGVAINWK